MMLYPVTLSPTMPPKLRKKKKSPTAPKEDINVGTSSKGIEKPEEIVSPFPREPSTVSMEGVESTEIAPSTKDREVTSTAPSVEEIKKWKRADVINFLQEKKEDLDIDDKHIQVIRDQEIAGQAFLRLTEEKLMRIGLTLGPAESIASLVETLKGGEVTLKRKYEESTENLTEIVKSAVREEFSRQKPDVISVSKLSETIMKKIMDDIGIKTVKLSVEDFLPLEPVSCEPFRWDIEQEEVQQMQDVEKWFKNVLSLPRNFHVKDVHKQVNFQRHLRGANTIITGGADIAVGPSETACVWIEIKKTLEDFKEGQAMGELFLIDKLHPTNAMTVLTDCNDNWIIYFFLKINEEQYMATSRIDDRSTALAIIRQFVLEEGQNFHNWIGKDITYQVDLPAPLKKKTKFLESITETVDARMADMVGDMSEQELFNMTARKRLMLVRDYCRLDEQPQVDQLIRQFSDNYENQPPMMFA